MFSVGEKTSIDQLINILESYKREISSLREENRDLEERLEASKRCTEELARQNMDLLSKIIELSKEDSHPT